MKKFALIGLSLLLLGGCATMEQAISPEVRYGQLYALEDALTTAGDQCWVASLMPSAGEAIIRVFYPSLRGR